MYITTNQQTSQLKNTKQTYRHAGRILQQVCFSLGLLDHAGRKIGGLGHVDAETLRARARR